MYGAIIGDIVGSKYEFANIKTKAFPLISAGCTFTDDTVMTVAVAKALLMCHEEEVPFRPTLVQTMKSLGRSYPNAGYGRRFSSWLHTDDPKPYNSYGNGSAMRVSPCGLIALTMDEAMELAKVSAAVTHDHPEGIKGAQATAAAVYLAKTGVVKEEIAEYIRSYFYDLSSTLEDIRPNYKFDVSCQNSVPQIQSRFNKNGNTLLDGMISLPKGQRVKRENLKHWTPRGIPIIVIQHNRPANAHIRHKNRPPKKTQMMFPMVLIQISPRV